MTLIFLDMTAVADRVNVTAATLRKYRSDGRLPPPDVMLGQSPGWTEDTVDAWIATRPGRTGRPHKNPRSLPMTATTSVRFGKTVRTHVPVVGFGGLTVGKCGAGSTARSPLAALVAQPATCPSCVR